MLCISWFIFACDNSDSCERGNHKDDGQRQADQRYRKGVGQLAQESAQNIADHRYGRGGQSVGQLGGYMVYVVAVGAGGSHDRSVGDGRAMVAADRAGQAGGDGNGQHFSAGKYAAYDRDQDAKGTPGGSCGKGKPGGHDKNNGREYPLQSRGGTGYQVSHKEFGSQQPGHAGQCPGHGQDQDRGHHSLKAFRYTVGEILESHHVSEHIEQEGDKQGAGGTQHQAHGGVGVCESRDKILTVKNPPV